MNKSIRMGVFLGAVRNRPCRGAADVQAQERTTLKSATLASSTMLRATAELPARDRDFSPTVEESQGSSRT